jgi:hypothetical protein
MPAYVGLCKYVLYVLMYLLVKKEIQFLQKLDIFFFLVEAVYMSVSNSEASVMNQNGL